MPRVTHFDISADDPERALNFYRNVFGWEVQKWEGPPEYWLLKTGSPVEAGIDGGLAKRDSPADSVTNFIDVPSVDDYLGRVEAHGGQVVQPKATIPGVGYIAGFTDTEGNVFGMMERDEKAQ